MKTLAKLILHILIFIFLTAVTQIGGLVYLLNKLINIKWKATFRFKSAITFITLYILTTIIIVPLLAPIFGREKIKNTDKIKPTNFTTVLFNRNYVKPEVNYLLQQVQTELKGTNIEIHYLDASFPFINRFPLLPHLSHNDGKKLDLSLIYETKNGEISTKQKSISGYGVFENPEGNEVNQIDKCLNDGFIQYDFPKYLTFGKINKELIFSEKGTKKLIESIL
ncbi:MAG: hypothetical protein KUG51_04515, partial [Urechidicola sp.]|nr:hypothetical protein [Urechidicola sp.]